MASRYPLVLILALSACGGTSLGISHSSPSTTSKDDVVALSRTAVEDASSSPDIRESSVLPTDSVDSGSTSSSVALGESMKAQAVPMADASNPWESPPEDSTADASEPDVPMATFTLRRGETLAHFARWSGYPVEDIAKFSDLTLDGAYPVGTEIQLPVAGEELAEIQTKRAEHLHKRVDGYLASRGGSVGNELYTVHTGDTAWGIARDDYGVPVWLLEAYNPSTDLDHLRPGQELMVPKLADTVADAGSDTAASPGITQPETASQPEMAAATEGTDASEPAPSDPGPASPPAQ